MLTKERIDKYEADFMEFDSVECEEVMPLIHHIREQDTALAAAREIMEKCEVADLRRLGLLDKARAWLAANLRESR
jgi:hypothetical protein